MVLPVRIPCEGQRALGQYNCSGIAEGASEAEAKTNARKAAGDDAIKQMLQRKAPFCATPPKGCSLSFEVNLGRGQPDGPSTHVVYKDSKGRVIKEVYGWLYSGIAEVNGVCKKPPAAKKPAGKKPLAKKKM